MGERAAAEGKSEYIHNGIMSGKIGGGGGGEGRGQDEEKGGVEVSCRRVDEDIRRGVMLNWAG